MTSLEWLIFILIPSLAWLLALGSSLCDSHQSSITNEQWEKTGDW